jgi:hypothetical protein
VWTDADGTRREVVNHELAGLLDALSGALDGPASASAVARYLSGPAG